MSNYLDRFRYKSGIEVENASRISDVIAASLSRYEVTVERLDKAIPIVFINSDKEGLDEAVIYSYNEDALVVGDYFYFSDYWYLIYKEQKNVKRENYIDSFLAVKCNINFNYDNSTVKAYFKGPLRSIRTDESSLSQNLTIAAEGQTSIMFPVSVGIGKNVNLTINEKGWRTTFIDNTTNPGITYAALEEYVVPVMNKVASTDIPDFEIIDGVPQLIAGIEYTFDTENGYFVGSKKVTIINRSQNTVKFVVPYGTASIDISIKQDGSIVTETYSVRG